MEYCITAYFEAPCFREKQLLQRKFALDRDTIVHQHFASARQWSTFSKAGYCGIVVTDSTGHVEGQGISLLFVVTSTNTYHDLNDTAFAILLKVLMASEKAMVV